MLFRRRKLMLVLGGGGVRGLAHLGILKVLEEAQVEIDGIVGTSAGAIVGSLYARQPNSDALTVQVLAFLSSPGFRRLNLRFDLKSRVARLGRRSFLDRFLKGLKRQVAMELLFRRRSIFHGEILERLVTNMLGGGRIEESKIPLFVTALDLVNGLEVVLDRGDLTRAVVASSSVPGFFPPVPWDEMLLTDAGLVNNMPISVAERHGAECVIAVNLNSRVDPVREFPTGIEVIFRNEEVGTKLINDKKRHRADVVIEPDLGGRYWLDFERPEEVIAAGEQAARRVLPDIEAAVRRRKLDWSGFKVGSDPVGDGGAAR